MTRLLLSDVPELPDILLYLHALAPRVIGHSLTGIRLVSPFLLRSVDPPRSVRSVRARRLAEGPGDDPRFDGTRLDRPDRPPAWLSDDRGDWGVAGLGNGTRRGAA